MTPEQIKLGNYIGLIVFYRPILLKNSYEFRICEW